MRIHVAVAENSAPWGLPMDLFADQLAEFRADARSAVRTQGSGEYVSFDLVVDGRRRDGGFFPDQQLILEDGPAEAWAPVIEWFLGLLPFDAGIDLYLETVATPRELPRNATVADIVRILTALDDSS
jgi:hypothetical protein